MCGFKARMVEVIADALRSAGEYRTELPADPAQPIVDTWWAAHAAGRLVGHRVRIANESRYGRVGQSLVIIVRLRRATAGCETAGAGRAASSPICRT